MARSDTLILAVTDFKDPQHWRWVLKDSFGCFLQDHEVGLDISDPNYQAFLDLEMYLDSYSSPDKRIEDQERLLDEMSSWIASKMLGKVADRLAERRVPTVIRVLVPPEASGLTYLPLELARVKGRPLALQDISLVFEITGIEHIPLEPIGDKLRMLAIFSLPTDVSALALRRERYELMRLINQIAQTHNLAIELRVLQYGVTRDNLREALEEGDGWDMIHLSGHGEEATVILEKPDGTKDYVSSKDLADLLSLSRSKLKFVALSSCLSAAATLEESLKWLKLWKPEMAQETSSPVESDGDPMPALARQLVESTDCAVLAMRYTVGDEFAITLANELYERLLGKGQTLPRALQLSLRVALSGDHGAASPPLSIATPALFGRRAAELIIKLSQAQKGEFKMPTVGLAYFPSEPVRFVGRSGPLVRASSALAPESDKRGVLFYGMAGAGKTACALELAYHHSRSARFQGFVWYKAPDEGKDIDRALLDLAINMETQLPGIKMVHVVGDLATFKNFLPVLKQFLEKNSILIVLDNLESLLTSQGTWRDERWKLLIDALQEHNGYSRVILTSRWLPHELKDERILIETIHSLSLNEAIILAREMPNLGRMLVGRGTVALEKGRELVTRTLELVQGHPKLMELAEALACDPYALEKALEKAAQVRGMESKLSSFFDDGKSQRNEKDFMQSMKSWTQIISETLPTASNTLFHVLCALEEPDRQSWIIKQVWPILWVGLELPDQAPEISGVLGDLDGLVEVQNFENGSQYIIHPIVAEVGLGEIEMSDRSVIDSIMADFWGSLLYSAKSEETAGKSECNQIVGAGVRVALSGLNSTPYLLRQGQLEPALYHLQETIVRDQSMETIIAILPMLRFIESKLRGSRGGMKAAGLLALALFYSDQWREAETLFKSLGHKWRDIGDFRSAYVAEGNLFAILHKTGRFEEALKLADEMKENCQKVDKGPWIELDAEALRLQALNSLGRYAYVLETIESIMERLKSLPETEMPELITSRRIKENILYSGVLAAVSTKTYKKALEFNSNVLILMEGRGANELELAKAEFRDYYSLLRLERYDQAKKLVLGCKSVFENRKDIESLGKAFNALADIEFQLGHIDHIKDLLDTALRYAYQADNIEDIAAGHNNHAAYFFGVDSNQAVAQRLASGIIRLEIKSGLFPLTLRNLSSDLAKFGVQSSPSDFDQLCSIVEVVGVRFRELFYRLAGPDADGDKVMQEVLRMDQEIDEGAR